MNLTWQLEVNDPRQATGWKALWEFSDDRYEAHKELADQLNQINAPIQFRIERKPD
jgi:hypothetical protein